MKCSVEGCEEVFRLRDLCIYHYHRKRTKGDTPPHPSKRIKQIKICTVADCDQEVQAISFYVKHYRQHHHWKRKGLITTQEEFRSRLAKE